MDVLKCSSLFDLPWVNIVDKVGTERGRIHLVPHSFPPIAFMRSNILQATQQRESMSTLCVILFLRRSLHRCEEGELVGGRGSREEEWVAVGRTDWMELLFLVE